MNSCEEDLYHNLGGILGPALAVTLMKTILDALVPTVSICTLSDSIGQLAREFSESLVTGIEKAAEGTIEFVKNHWYWVFPLIGVIIGAHAPLALEGFVVEMGFGVGGIVAGSPASQIMALYGGKVTTGSICATLQSIGAAGLSEGTSYIVSLAGAVAGESLGNRIAAKFRHFLTIEGATELDVVGENKL
ncbi:hypothetical protein BGX34_011973 [Mortierella sp. NVP85]|nr:hypothetical protein BGX34_011973 [Mortierella sp. NVP85]